MFELHAAIGLVGGGAGGLRRRVGVFAAAGLVAFGAGCQRAEAPDGAREPGPMRVVVSVPPLAGLVRALLPEDADVRSVVQAGQSPHTYEPRPEDLAALARADLIVVVGLGMESMIPAASLDTARTLVMADALGISAPDGGEHGAGGDHAHEGHEHGHGGAEPHLWLDPVLVERFVPALGERVRGALQDAAGEAPAIAALDQREADLLARVREVDRQYRARLAPFAGGAIITQHAAWSRLAERYGLGVAGVIQEAESVEPPAGHIAELIETAAAQRVGGIFSEPQLDRTIAGRLGEQLGIPVGILDPEGGGDWSAMMLANLDELVRVLGGGRGGG
ncbi:MAG TPA: metal ABC transporter substrate-binding protein [Phycisphaerales bacterium]|nr:metal ABC transporter substrate-binding protein [Phycisphaerales bacterium]